MRRRVVPAPWSRPAGEPWKNRFFAEASLLSRRFRIALPVQAAVCCTAALACKELPKGLLLAARASAVQTGLRLHRQAVCISFLFSCMAIPHETPPANREPDADIWCHCDGGYDDPFYSPDGWCQCGIKKHHWHCQRCKGLVQIG